MRSDEPTGDRHGSPARGSRPERRPPVRGTPAGERWHTRRRTGTTARPPSSLRARVLDAAGIRRPPGQPVPPVAPADPLSSFRRQADAVRDALATVPDTGWERRADPYPWTVHGLVGHLVGVERYLGGRLGLWPFQPVGPEHDHLGVTEPFVAATAGARPAATSREWRRLVEAVAAHVDGLDAAARQAAFAFHGLPLSIDTVLVLRTFELWTHADDVLRALDRPPLTPCAEDLAGMADFSLRSLFPATLIVAPHQSARSARIVLTGPGGGVWRLGADTAATDVNIVANALAWCRMAARRLAVEELRAQVSGDRELAQDLFQAARLLAA